MKNYILNILIIFGVFTLFLISFKSASAALTIEDCMEATWTTPVGCDKVLDSYYSGYYNSGYNYSYTSPQYSTYTSDSAYNNQYSSRRSTTPVVNNYYYQTLPIMTNKQVASTSTTTKTASTAKSSTSSKTTTSAKSDDSSVKEVAGNQEFRNTLPALSFQGSGGFFPSSFWQWLIVIFLILVIVILARLIARHPRKEVHYTSSPAH